MVFQGGTFRSYFGAVCIPVLDPGDGTISNVTHEWAQAMAAVGGGLAVTVMRMHVRNYRVDIAKERLVEMAIKNHAQYILMIDDDVIPPSDSLLKMISLWKSDPKYKIISGVYWSKSEPSVPLLFKGNMEGSYWDWKTTDIIEADAGGAGLLFVDTEVFKKMSKPWFSTEYYFDDPRAGLDVEYWQLTDYLGQEVSKGKNANEEVVEDLRKRILDVQSRIEQAKQIEGQYLLNRKADAGTTEDIYFFKKAKDELGLSLWFDCSIQAEHQDKKTGRTWGIRPGMPQTIPRYEGKMSPDDGIVLDIGAGTVNFQFQEGKAIRIDNNPENHPDIICDARRLPIEDCFADMVFASHILEHFSFRETISVLKEWVRTLKVDGKLVITVPNLKWASKVILEGHKDQEIANRAMYTFYSYQAGDLKDAQEDVHRAGFTQESLAGLLKRIPGLRDIQVFTSDGIYQTLYDETLVHQDGLGFNLIAIAYKERHNAPVSTKMPFPEQIKAMGDDMPRSMPKKKVRKSYKKGNKK